MQHTSWDGVLNEIRKEVQIALQNEVAIIVYNTVREYLMKTVYEKEPSMYERTFETLNSVTVGKAKTVGDSVEIEVYLDSSKIIPEFRDGLWNAHMTMSGQPFNQELPWVLEQGDSGGRYPVPKFEYMKKSKTEIEDKNLHLKALQQALLKKGIMAVIK